MTNKNIIPIIVKTMIITVIAIVIIASLFSCKENQFKNKYIVEITYCDGRPKENILVLSNEKPNNSRIRVYQQAVPTYLNKLNVCNVKTLKKIN